MKGHAVSEVSVGDNLKPLTWPEEADKICLFATTEGYKAPREWLGLALFEEIKKWLDNWERTKGKEDIEFYHLLIRVNANIGMFHVLFSMHQQKYLFANILNNFILKRYKHVERQQRAQSRCQSFNHSSLKSFTLLIFLRKEMLLPLNELFIQSYRQ